MKQKEYREIILKRTKEGIGDTWFSLIIFMLLNPLYSLWLSILFFITLPMNFFFNTQSKPIENIQQKKKNHSVNSGGSASECASMSPSADNQSNGKVAE